MSATLVSSCIQCLMVGDMAISCVKLITTSPRPYKPISTYLILASASLALSQSLQAFVNATTQPDTVFWLNMIGSYLQTVGVLFIIKLLYIRNQTAHRVAALYKYLAWFFAALALFFVIAVRIVNTANDVASYRTTSAVFPNSLTQFLRTMLNIGCAASVLYFETFTTRLLTTLLQAKPDKSTYYYGVALSIAITLMFLVQSGLQLYRAFEPKFTFAPFFQTAWSLALKRVIEFKEELGEAQKKSKASTEKGLSSLQKQSAIALGSQS
ncbi:hypothetical protein BC833DRAFT_623102 [Globomyces pollinis-pini]|nr:hypothetical protein BC833DRAFT_623102 [Globomyces pollinis-pini]